VGKTERFKKHSESVARRFKEEEDEQRERGQRLQDQFKSLEAGLDFKYLPADEQAAWAKLNAVASGYGE
jgi:hypothetical protein